MWKVRMYCALTKGILCGVLQVSCLKILRFLHTVFASVRATLPFSFTTKWNIFCRASANSWKYSESCQQAYATSSGKLQMVEPDALQLATFEAPCVTELWGVNFLSSRWLRTYTCLPLILQDKFFKKFQNNIRSRNRFPPIRERDQSRSCWVIDRVERFLKEIRGVWSAW